MEKITLEIGGMHCVRCSTSLENALKNVKGISSACVSYASGKASVEYDSTLVSYKQICKIVKNAGFYVVDGSNKDKEFKITLSLFVISGILTIPFIIMMVLMFANEHNNLFHNGWFQLSFVTPIQFIVGYKFYKRAFDSLKNKSPNMDLLVAMGTSVAYFYSLYNLISGVKEYYFESCAFVITLVFLGKLLEIKSKNKTNEALSSLLKLKPNKVTVVEGKVYKEIDINELEEDDIFIVKAGESVATDGVVIEGSGNLDESMLTGESVPKYKEKGLEVYGGTVNTDGVLMVRATRVGEATILASIIRMVESAQSSKAKVQRLADKVSAYFVPSIVFIALITFVINFFVLGDVSVSVSRAVSVLVIACPCSLGLATPTAIIVGMGKAAKKGILIKDADALESMCKVKTIILDKTGTITKGEIVVDNVEIVDYDEKEFASIVSKAEEYSNHPLAKAIVKYYGKSEIELRNVKEITGKGIEAIYNNKNIKVGSYNYLSRYINNDGNKDKTSVFVVIDDSLAGVIYFRDQIKDSSNLVVSKLKNSGVEVVLASGDNKEICEETANSVGISKVYSEVLPEDKYKIVEEFKKNGLVAMVGDGINDAPALAKADVGIAMGSGIDVAVENGDLVIINNDLMNVYSSLLISKATMKKIKQNLFWAFFYNCVGVPLACFGIISPIIAGLCMSFSSVSVVINSLILNKVKI